MKIKMLKKYVYMTACYGSGWRKAKQYAKQYASANQIPARAAIRLARGYWLDVRESRQLIKSATLGYRYGGMENAIIQGTSATLLVMDDYGELEVKYLANQVHDDLTDASSYLFH